MTWIKPKASSAQRGYGVPHRAERQRWQDQLNQGLEIRCACAGQCGRHRGRDGKPRPCRIVINANSDWHLMHTPDRKAYLGPGCVPCNLGEAARRGARKANRRRKIIRTMIITADRW
jgi:hypothetical protein